MGLENNLRFIIAVMYDSAKKMDNNNPMFDLVSLVFGKEISYLQSIHLSPIWLAFFLAIIFIYIRDIQFVIFNKLHRSKQRDITKE